MSDTNLSSFIWSVADLLRGDYKQSEYGKVNVVLGTKGKRKGQPVPDANLRDTENVPLGAAKHSPPRSNSAPTSARARPSPISPPPCRRFTRTSPPAC